MPSDFFARLLERTVRPGATVQPRLATPFLAVGPEPVQTPTAPAEDRRRAARHVPHPGADAPPGPEAEAPAPHAADVDGDQAPAVAAVREDGRPAPREADGPRPLVAGDEVDADREGPATPDDSVVETTARPRSGRGGPEDGAARPRTSRARVGASHVRPAPRAPRLLLPPVPPAARGDDGAAIDADGREASPEPPVVRIDIGRVEVTATPLPAPARAENRLMSLADYLGDRGRRRR
jgi:hypothetical protein